MAKSTNVELDDKSLEVLKKVDGVHRNSLINLGISMISKTSYYKGLTGDVEDAMAVVSLNSLDEESSENKCSNLTEETTPQGPNKRSKPSIDIGFDDF